MSGILMMSVGNSYGSLPVNTVAPVVSGTATVGQTLSTTNGTWLGAPAPTFTYQWQRNTSNISGATSSTYVLQAADAGNTVRCVVTATNAVGVTSANSNSTATVNQIPANTVAPVVSGTASVGATLSTTNGTWTGTPAPSFSYQWQRSESNIGGATSSTYVIQLADVGNTLRCVVTGTNAVGSASANSNSTASVASPYWASFLASPSSTFITNDNARDSSGNLYSVGRIGGATGGGFLTKYNNAGTLLWQRLINDAGSPGQFDPTGVAVDSSGNIYVVGQYFTGHIIKFDSSGNVIFRKTTAGIGTSAFYKVTTDSSNNVYISGFRVIKSIIPIIVKTDSSCNLIWAKQWSESSGNTRGPLAVDGSNNVYFTTERSQSGRRTRLFKLNSSGTQQWARELYSFSDTDVIVEDIAVDSAGSVYACGRTTYQTFGGEDIFLVKWDTSGVFQWQRRLGGTSTDQGYALAVSSAGDSYITGQFFTPGVAQSPAVRYNSSGTIQWQRSIRWRTIQNTAARGMSLNGENGFYVSGSGYTGTDYSVTNAYLPLDGSRTGSYTNFTYTASSLSETAATFAEGSFSGSTADVSGLTLPDSTTFTVTTSSFASTLTNV